MELTAALTGRQGCGFRGRGLSREYQAHLLLDDGDRVGPLNEAHLCARAGQTDFALR